MIGHQDMIAEPVLEKIHRFHNDKLVAPVELASHVLDPRLEEVVFRLVDEKARVLVLPEKVFFCIEMIPAVIDKFHQEACHYVPPSSLFHCIVQFVDDADYFLVLPVNGLDVHAEFFIPHH